VIPLTTYPVSQDWSLTPLPSAGHADWQSPPIHTSGAEREVAVIVLGTVMVAPLSVASLNIVVMAFIPEVMRLNSSLETKSPGFLLSTDTVSTVRVAARALPAKSSPKPKRSPFFIGFLYESYFIIHFFMYREKNQIFLEGFLG
jgi:hypothetical protein